MANSNKGSMDFGKSRAKLSADGGKVLWILGIKKSKYDIDKGKSYDIIYKYKKKEEEK